MADTATAHVSTLTIDTDGSVANGTAQNSATATVVDSQNNILANTTVNWTVTGSAGLTSGTSTTNGSGQAVMTFTDTKAETVTLTAKAGSSDAGQSKTSSFVPDSAKFTIDQISLKAPSGNTTVASIGDSIVAKVHVVDSQGSSVNNANVTFNVTGAATLDSPSGTTDSTGWVTVNFTDSVGETVTFTGTLDNGNDSTATMLFQALPFDLVLTQNGARGSAADPIVFTAVVTDKFNNKLQGIKVGWSQPGGFTACSILGGGVTNSNGEAQFSCHAQGGSASGTSETATVTGPTEGGATVSDTLTNINYFFN